MKISTIPAPFDSFRPPYDAREDNPRADLRGWPQDALFKSRLPSRLQPSASGLVSARSRPVEVHSVYRPRRSDNWDHMVFVRMFGRLTVYDFPTPPEGGSRPWLRDWSLVHRGSEAMASGCFSAHIAELVASGIYLFRDIPI
jgi:hypothetical protein